MDMYMAEECVSNRTVVEGMDMTEELLSSRTEMEGMDMPRNDT
jgi:hypothetical protein